MALDPSSPWASVVLPPEWDAPAVDPYSADLPELAAPPPVPPAVIPSLPVEEVPRNESTAAFVPPVEAPVAEPEPMPVAGRVSLPWEAAPAPVDPAPVAQREYLAATVTGDGIARDAGEATLPAGMPTLGQQIQDATTVARRQYLPDAELDQDQLNARVAKLGPEQLAMRDLEAQRAREAFAQRRQLEEIEADQTRRQTAAKLAADARARASAARADVATRAKKLAETEITDGAWMESRAPAQKVAAYAAAILGGLASGSTGGRNLGIEAIERTIQNHTANLRANLQNRMKALDTERGAIDDQLALDMDAAREAEVVAQGMREAAIRKLEIEVQQFDPRGTTAIETAKAIQAIRARQASAEADYEESQFKRRMEIAKFGLDQDKHLLDVAKADADRRAKLASGRGGGMSSAGRPVKPDDVVQPPEHFEMLYGKRPPIAMSQNSFEQWAKTGKLTQDLIKSERENSSDERARQFGVGEILDTEGRPLLFRTSEGAEKVGAQKAAADFMVQLLDRMDAAYQRHGWSSDLVKSPEWQEAQSDLNTYILEKKNLDQLGVLAGPDLELIKGSYGALNITGVLDPGPGLRRARENTIAKINSTIRAQAAGGVKPARWAPPPPRPAAPISPEQAKVQRLLTYDPGRPSSDVVAELGGPDAAYAAYQEGRRDLPQSHRAAIDGLVAVFNDPGRPQAERDQAGAHLAKLAADAKSASIRDYATSAASAGALASVPMGDPLR